MVLFLEIRVFSGNMGRSVKIGWGFSAAGIKSVKEEVKDRRKAEKELRSAWKISVI